MFQTSKLINILSIPLIILNVFGAIFSGIWLAIDGEWHLIFVGLAYMLLASFLIAIILLPTLLFGAGLVRSYKKRNTLAMAFFAFLSLGYTYFIMFLSSYFVFGTFIQSAGSETSLFAVLVWSYAVATTPWSAMATREEGDGTFFSLLSLEFGLLIAMIIIGIFGQDFSIAFVYMFYFMLIPLSMGVKLAVHTTKNGGENILLGRESNTSNYSQVELETFIFSLIYVANADGVFHYKEVLEIQDGFRKLTKENVSKKFIKKLSNLSNSELIEAINQGSEEIETDIKEDIIKAACYVARSDNDIHTNEKNRILEIGKNLGLDKDKIAQISKRTHS